ncbi:MAG: CDC27 family protein [Spirochaetia bacterium]
MIELLPYVVAALILIVVFFLFIILFQRSGSGDEKKQKKRKKNKDRNAILREANKKLAVNPKDPDALLAIADLYYSEEAWEKAFKSYSILLDVCATNPDLDEFDITLKYALSALKLKKFGEAHKGLMLARTMKQDVFEINYNLGYLEYSRKNFEKAVSLLKQAVNAQPEHVQSLRYFGHSLHKIKHYKEALGILKKVTDQEPDDKESIFAMAECYYELGMSEQAVKIFTHLRADPKLGPNAALFAGTLHMKQKQYPKAIMDFEIGLKHQSIKQDIELELKYRLAAAYVKQQDIDRTLSLLREIANVYANYKDVSQQIKRYAELNRNKNLQIYLMAPTSEFVTVCRKIASHFFPKAKVKIQDISVQKAEYADVLAEIHTPKWEDLVLFRFIRTTGTSGEFIVRDLHSRIKEVRAGRGFCLSAGTFTEGAKQFVEARLIDIVEKDELMNILRSFDTSKSFS